MKLSLVVSTMGKSEGRVIPITLAQFLIGRDPECQLRPASELISKRHCAVLVKDGKAFIRDFDSTNGTFVNGEPVKGERELNHDDKLKVGPLLFGVRIDASTPVNRPTPPPPTKTPAQAAKPPVSSPAAADKGDDESIAAMLLALDDGTPSGTQQVGSGEIPQGSTVMDILNPLAPGQEGQDPSAADPGKANDKGGKPAAKENTSSAAKAILEKYMKRPRG